MKTTYLFLSLALFHPMLMAKSLSDTPLQDSPSLRPLSTDRPDTTESPITVDAGRVQIEMSFFDYSRDSQAGDRMESWTIGSLNLKYGLSDRADLQLVFESYVLEKETVGGDTTIRDGIGDLSLRFKYNFLGNDGGAFGLGIMPFVTFPTGAMSHNHVEGGLIIPLSMDLNETFSLGVMIEGDVVYLEDRNAYGLDFVHSIVLGIEWTERLGCFLEYVGAVGAWEGADYQASFITGATWSVNERVQLDAGVRLGLNEAAEDVGFFTGMSVKF